MEPTDPVSGSEPPSYEVGSDHVAVIRLCYPPNNFFNLERLLVLARAFESVDENPQARAILLCSEGKNFCAGADFASRDSGDTMLDDTMLDDTMLDDTALADPHIYDLAVRLFACQTPVVAAVQGAAVGGGLGLACMADFRVGGPGSRFSANFARLGFHQGFALSITLPAILGQQRAMELLYTGRRIRGAEAERIGLVDRLAANDQSIEAEARHLAAEIAGSAPLAVRSIRHTLRGDLAQSVRLACDHERNEQERLAKTNDWREGIAAMAERREPNFNGN